MNKKTFALFSALSLFVGVVSFVGFNMAKAQTNNQVLTNNNVQSASVIEKSTANDPADTTVSDPVDQKDSSSETNNETDAVGGHQDVNGMNVDHQFEGVE